MKRCIVLLQIIYGIFYSINSLGIPLPPEAGIVLKNGSPCFYSISPIDKYTNNTIASIELDAMLKNGNWVNIWTANSVQLSELPDSPRKCIPYGVSSSHEDKDDILAHPLSINTPYQFSIDEESMGYQEVAFCISEDDQGKKYISKFYKECTTEPLPPGSRSPYSLEFALWDLIFITSCSILTFLLIGYLIYKWTKK